MSHRLRSASRRPQRHPHLRRLRVESLEARLLLAVVTVDTALDVFDPSDGVTSLREAIFATNIVPGADEIVFDFGHDGPATILLEQGELEITDELTITGDGPELLTIDAQQQSRIFNITAEEGDFVISGMTITRGRTTGGNAYRENTNSGGAIRSLTTGNLVIENCTVSRSSTTGWSTGGGGVVCEGDVSVTDSTISGNSTESGDGGGIHGRNVTVTSSTISSNAASSYGGGIFGRSSVTVTFSTITGNSANWNGGSSNGYSRGGGIYGSNVTVTSSTITGNAAIVGPNSQHRSQGGGIYGGNVTVTSSTISNNSAEYSGNGGGIFGNTVTTTSSTITGNSVGWEGNGGGIFGNNVTVAFSTIAGNSGGDLTGVGGGIYGNDVTVTSSTISGNSARQGGGIAVGGNATIAFSTITNNLSEDGGGSIRIRSNNSTAVLSHTIVAGNLRTTGNSPPVADDLSSDAVIELGYSLVGTAVGAVNTTPGTINYFGVDPLLGPLQDNGAPTWTHALLPGSPAIDAGDPQALTGVDDVPEFDQRGAPYRRVADGDGDGTARIDIGSHERQALTVEMTDVASPTLVPVEEITVQFSTTINGFEVDDLVLSFNGGENLLTDSQALSTHDNQTFILGNLSDVTTASGYYTLTLNSYRSAIVDTNGDPMETGDSVSWAMGRSVLGLTVDTLVDELDGSIDDGDISLRDAIAAAAPGETIDFDMSLSGGTILLAIGELLITRPLTIDATALDAGLVIDASGNDRTPDLADGKGSRIFDIDDTNGFMDSPMTIRGLTLTGGDVSGAGGAIRTQEPLTLTKSAIWGNSADWRGGGGIYSGVFSDYVTVTSSLISRNTTDGDGGGIRASGDVVVSSSTISGNSAADPGGGIWGHDVTVTSSIISGNLANGYGGGISGDNVTVTSSTISENSAKAKDTQDHRSYSGGGGISGLNVTVTSSTISGNSADEIGGGIAVYGPMTITDSTITGNSAKDSGGGISAWGDSAVLSHTIVAGNLHGNVANDLVNIFGSSFKLDHTLLGVDTGAKIIDRGGNLIGTAAAPIDPRLGPLADNGGPTWTHALLPGSPAIDAGDPNIALDENTFDQRGNGFFRVADGGVSGLRIDIGAYESQGVPQLTAGDYNGNGIVGQGDLDLVRRNWGAPGESPPEGWVHDLPDTRVDQNELDRVLLNWGNTLETVAPAEVSAPVAVTVADSLSLQSWAQSAGRMRVGPVRATASDRVMQGASRSEGASVQAELAIGRVAESRAVRRSWVRVPDRDQNHERHRVLDISLAEYWEASL